MATAKLSPKEYDHLQAIVHELYNVSDQPIMDRQDVTDLVLNLGYKESVADAVSEYLGL